MFSFCLSSLIQAFLRALTDDSMGGQTFLEGLVDMEGRSGGDGLSWMRANILPSASEFTFFMLLRSALVRGSAEFFPSKSHTLLSVRFLTLLCVCSATLQRGSTVSKQELREQISPTPLCLLSSYILFSDNSVTVLQEFREQCVDGHAATWASAMHCQCLNI